METSTSVAHPTVAVAIESTKKRGRPQKLEDGKDASWTPAMIEALLLEKQLNARLFLEAKEKKSISIGWAKITLSINSQFNESLSSDQIKNKYQYLQKTFRQLTNSDKLTGNVKLPKKPCYWDAMVSHFGGNEGLAHECLNYAVDQKGYESDGDFAANRSVSTTPHNNRKSSRTSQQDALTSLGSDLKEGLITMGQELGRGLAAAFSNTSNDEIKRLSDITQHSQESLFKQQKLLMDQNKETNDLLKQFIQFMMNK